MMTHQQPGGEEAGPGGTVARAFLVSGRVQGVGFRWWTKRTADELGLAGAVRNRRDGRVELRVRGAPDAVGSLAVRLRQGPPAARVEAVEELDGAEALDRLEGLREADDARGRGAGSPYDDEGRSGFRIVR